MPQMIPACFKWKLPVFSDDDQMFEMSTSGAYETPWG